MRAADRHCCDGRCQHGGTCPALLAPGTISGPYRRRRGRLSCKGRRLLCKARWLLTQPLSSAESLAVGFMLGLLTRSGMDLVALWLRGGA